MSQAMKTHALNSDRRKLLAGAAAMSAAALATGQTQSQAAGAGQTLLDAITAYIATARHHRMTLNAWDGRVCVLECLDENIKVEGDGMLELGIIEQRIRAFPDGMAKLAALLPRMEMVGDDPVYAALAAHRTANSRLQELSAAYHGVDRDKIPGWNEVDDVDIAAFAALAQTVPTTLGGCAALAQAVVEYPDFFDMTADEGAAQALVSLATGLKQLLPAI